MSILWAGGEIADFDEMIGSVTYQNSTIYRDANYSRTALSSSNSSTILRKNIPAGQTDVWFKGRVFIQTLNTTSGFEPIAITNVLRVAGSGTSGLVNIQRWDGAAWVTFATHTLTSTGIQVFVLRAKIAVDGVLQLYANDVLVGEYLGDTSARSFTTVSLSALANAWAQYWSECIMASHDILSARLKTLAITGAGAVQEWSGVWSDVDAHDESDDSFLAEDTAGQKSTFAIGDLFADSLNVDAVIVAGRFRRNDTGPTGINALVRKAGVDYGQSIGVLTTSFQSNQVIFAVDPSTSAQWSREDVDALEIGVEAVA